MDNKALNEKIAKWLGFKYQDYGEFMSSHNHDWQIWDKYSCNKDYIIVSPDNSFYSELYPIDFVNDLNTQYGKVFR
jgi:predicted nuclease of predicted toxin-antitoxin system